MSSVPEGYPSIDTLITQLKEINKEIQSSDALAEAQPIFADAFSVRSRENLVLKNKAIVF